MMGSGLKMFAEAALVAVMVGPAYSGVSFETIALTGLPVPGADPGVSFSSFNDVALNNLGQVAFRAELTGTGVQSDNDLGIYSGNRDSLVSVVRQGETIAGIGSVSEVLNLQYPPVLSDSGKVSFAAPLGGPGSFGGTFSAVLSSQNGTISLIALQGEPPPGVGPDVEFGFAGRGFAFFDLSINAAGDIAFQAYLKGDAVDESNSYGLFAENGGVLELAARAGDSAPGTGPDVLLDLRRPARLHVNDLSEFAFRSGLEGAGVSATDDNAVFSNVDGTTHVVTRAGDTVPGDAIGETFTAFSDPTLNNAGHVAFVAGITGPEVDETNEHGLIFGNTENLNLIARSGDVAPGISPDTYLDRFDQISTLNNLGQVALEVKLSGNNVDVSNDRAFYLADAETLSLIVREGDAAPDAGPGITFDRFSSVPVLNDAGRVSFAAELTGLGVDATKNLGVFASNHQGLLRLVVRTGDVIDVNPDPLVVDERTVSSIRSISGFGGSNTQLQTFNDHSQLSFTIGFTDGSAGVLISTLTTDILGDYNNSGQVEQGDLDLVLQNWGLDTTPGSGAGVPAGWVNDPPEGVIDQAELDGVLLNWGGTSAPEFSQNPGVVPEPAAALGVVLAGWGVASRRSRAR